MSQRSYAITRDIRVEVEARYVPDRSAPDEKQWFFAYAVKIENLGEEVVQLLSRHWIITDANGRVDEVQGAGVIGEQPVLRPGETFAYASACPLPTPMGTMHGTYQMVTDEGERFDAKVAPFTLCEPFAIN